MNKGEMIKPVKTIGRVSGHSSRLSETIDDIVFHSIIEDGNLILKNEKVDFFEILEEISREFTDSFNDSGLKLHCQLDSKLIKNFTGDAAKIKQIITNIIENILKYKLSGKVEINIFEKSMEGKKTVIVISVFDTCIGLAAEYDSSAHYNYESFDDHCMVKQNGYGLRFSIVKKIIGVMLGIISVRRRNGTGREFMIELPLLSE